MAGSSEFDVTLDGDGNPIPEGSSAPTMEAPTRIGRYRIERLLGEGGFGLVYLAFDEQLQRSVAVKVPHASLVARTKDAENYLVEARTVAKLDHPHIVPVYDVGSTELYPCYVVSKFIEGQDLASKLSAERLSYSQTIELVATLASALHYAHKHRVFHRDIKPGNILIDKANRPYIVDFGLALTEENLGQGPKCAGTPAYMSPEQAKGEGHRVDGRSDVFSLGVVLYEALSGRRPFKGSNHAEVLEQVARGEPRPLRQTDENLSKELERIVRKAMAKRATDRYSTAHDLSEDLRYLLAQNTFVDNSPATQMTMSRPAITPPSTQVGLTTGDGLVADSRTASQSSLVKIVPKGLRSFDAHDSDFFLELLPGPCDRDGLPDSLRFWKSRIEETDPDETFSVGLIYGPSGCGKSSLVKAGLVPRLSEDVVTLYLEATPGDTETRLMNGLRKRCPDLPEGLSLKETLTTLRRDESLRNSRKLVIFIDQFEQWLHANKEETDTELVQALRQCDGGRVQCVVMVRDDFWLAVTRFLRELEIRLVEGGNSALVDLFDQDHARRVLAAFGRAFDRLPESSGDLSSEQRDFLRQAVEGLSVEGKVICVRLALFAEMMKGKPWDSSTLAELGGTQGVGATFLEESFVASTAPPEHRYHQKAAMAILQDLLPEAGSNIKGYMRSHSDLLKSSGYGDRSRDFDDLIRILDSEMRLITPTDPAGKETAQDATDGEKYYQLTHDYLVHSLRDWLTRTQKETRRGRAELLLRDLSATWNERCENRFLPSWLENVSLRWLTDRKKWTKPQRSMMSTAGWFHGIRTAVAAAVLLALFAGAWTWRAQTQRRQRELEASRLVEGLLTADTNQLTGIIRNLEDYRDAAKDDLTAALENEDHDSSRRLHAALALLPQDKSLLPFLSERLLTISSDRFTAVRSILQSHSLDVAESCRVAIDDQSNTDAVRFQAFCALAGFATSDECWEDVANCEFVSETLVSVLPSDLAPWRDALRPVRDRLIPRLTEIFRDPTRQDQNRLLAEDVLLSYLKDRPDQLFEMLADAEPSHFEPVFRSLKPFIDDAVAGARRVVSESIDSVESQDEKERLALRQTNAAILLLRSDTADSVWPLFQQSSDPRVRSRLIHAVKPMGIPVSTLLDRVPRETDITARRALLLAIGEYELSDLDPPTAEKFRDSLRRTWQNADDAGLHAAAEWLLKQWDDGDWLAEMRGQLIMSEERIQQIDRSREWFVNGQGQTYVIAHADEFRMGSPPDEIGRKEDETRHVRKIGRTLAVCTTEVTHEQWRRFSDSGAVFWKADNTDIKPYVKSDDSPMLAMTWYEAAFYCNWLSDVEGIPRDQWCYEPNAEGVFFTGMKAKENFTELSGYRLPTEAEWEFFCRSGAETACCFGQTTELLSEYAWSMENAENRVWPVGSLKPNDFGLFDMIGNAPEWCYEIFADYPVGLADDSQTVGPVDDESRRVLRGGWFYFRPENNRSAQRKSNQPGNRDSLNSFRPVRTWTSR